MPTEQVAPSPGGGGPDDYNIFIAISSGKVNRLHSILNSSEELNIRDKALRTPLIHAVYIANDDIRTHVVRLLLRHGADVNAQDSLGRTALMYACMERDKVDVVRLLAKCRRCDPNLSDGDGNTALLHCVEGGNSSAIRILTNHTGMKQRLKVNQTNGAGLSAIELSVKLGLPDCCRILLKDGGADTARIKNRHLLMELLHDDKGPPTPYEQSVAPSPDDMDFPPTPRPVATPRGGGGGGGGAAASGLGPISHRSDVEHYTRTRNPVGGGGEGRGPDTPRPGSDFPSKRPSADIALRLGHNPTPHPGALHHPSGYHHHSSYPGQHPGASQAVQHVLERQNSMGRQGSLLRQGSLVRPASRDFHNPFLEMVRQDSALYVPNSRTTFRRTIIQRPDNKAGRSAKLSRRPLTPISRDHQGQESPRSASPTQNLPLPNRLPSIPSGKRVFQHAHSAFVSPCDTPTYSHAHSAFVSPCDTPTEIV